MLLLHPIRLLDTSEYSAKEIEIHINIALSVVHKII